MLFTNIAGVPGTGQSQNVDVYEPCFNNDRTDVFFVYANRVFIDMNRVKHRHCVFVHLTFYM